MVRASSTRFLDRYPAMQRPAPRPSLRLALPAGLTVLLALLLSACAGVGALLGNQITFTAGQLQQQLQQRFPRDYAKLGGLVSVQLRNPRLSIPAAGNRLQLDFDVGVGALGQPAGGGDGHISLSSGLRFDAAKRGLMLDAPSLDRIELPGQASGSNAAARELVNLWLHDWARDEPVYQLDEGLMQSLLARRIGATRIGDGMVTLQLDP